MAQNKLEDLRNHLFAQLERLGDDEEMEDPEKLKAEIKKAEAVTKVSNAITETAKVEVQYLKTLDDVGEGGLDIKFIKGSDDVKKLNEGGGE